ncbi:MAG: alcohol dehydrogenase catalytic domain-containing protein [Alphaproteobacteria bacterium]|nr:alcohol dehydrogenase catalytic domain-containing protein [Alphaproteobacteria bacterium]
MRAVVIHAPKDLRLDTLAERQPGPGEVMVRIGMGGICGSDLHYYNHGGFGTVRIREPMTLGHEVSGTVAAVGEGVANVRPGTRVAVNPSRPCLVCKYCEAGLHNQCLDMRFFGSAMRFPHVQGAFSEHVTVLARQAVPVPERISLAEAAMAEPLSVCLHAANQAGALFGKRVLVTGCGPIGALMVLVARTAGAAEIVATDIASRPLETALKVGATRAIDPVKDPDALKPYAADKGSFDVHFEASGTEVALRTGIELVRPRGTIVQIGVGGEAKLPMNVLVAKEIALRGTFRFDDEFDLAVRMMGDGIIDVRPVISDTFPVADAHAAFELAGDRNKAMKVQIAF